MVTVLIEEIYSTVQGEGYYTGVPCNFIRLWGCPVKCHYCDQGYNQVASRKSQVASKTKLSLEQVLRRLDSLSRVVITGGEPFMHDQLNSLCEALIDDVREVSIEASGGVWQEINDEVWITLSPKEHISKYPVVPIFYERASELKIVIETGEEADYYGDRIKSFLNSNKPVYFQPEWFKREVATNLCIALTKRFEGARLSLQTHKYIGLP